MSEQTTTAVAAANRTRTESQARSIFFVSMSGILLLIVLLGFSPTLYLRAYFDASDVPIYLLIHGAFLTAWFVWFFVQTSLDSRLPGTGLSCMRAVAPATEAFWY